MGHQLVVTSSKDRSRQNSVATKNFPDGEIVISQPFWPALHGFRAERFANQEARRCNHCRHRLRSHRSEAARPDG